MPRDDPADATATIDRTEADLIDIVEALRTDGTITDDDADEFRHRARTIGAELRACVQYADDGPLAQDDEH